MKYASHQVVPARRRYQLPRIWAGFGPTDTVRISGQGPELEAASQHQGHVGQTLFRRATRTDFGLVLYPLAWVSHESPGAVVVFADLARFPRRQMIAMTQPGTDLVGHHGATPYGFYNSRFRAYYKRPLAWAAS